MNQTREMLETWDPAALAGINPDTWRLRQMAADVGGDLGRAVATGWRGAALARTRREAAAAAELLTLVEHEAGHPDADLQEARLLVRLQPRQPDAWLVLRGAERCLAAHPSVIARVARSVAPCRTSDARQPLPDLSRSRCAEAISAARDWTVDAPARSQVAPVQESKPAQDGPSAAAPGTDSRLDRKVWVHATNERIADLLAGLTRATGVTLVANMVVADERISVWAEDQSLKEIMRDVRHLHGYYWSRAKRGGQYAYSLWQDAQSRAREEAETQRLALDEQREFQDDVWKHVRALGASHAEMERLAQEDPYLVAQMLHPVVRAGYQLFAALSPDQQAQLLQGQTPSRALPAGEMLEVLPLQTFTAPSAAHPGQTVTVFSQPLTDAMTAPEGDVVTLGWADMSPVERAAVEAMFGGAQALEEREAGHATPSPYGNPYEGFVRRLKGAVLESAIVSVFRWGEPGEQGLNVRVTFQSDGRGWSLNSNIAGSADADQVYNNLIRTGQFRLWAGADEDLRPYLAAIRKGADQPSGAPVTRTSGHPPDPVLDAPTTVDWVLPIRGGRPVLFTNELLAALQREIRRPLIVDSGYPALELPRGAPADFRWHRQPLRALLQRLFPRWECTSSGGALFLRNPDRLSGRLNQVPPAVERLLDDLMQRKQPFTLDDMALLARTLSARQIVKLGVYLPPPAIDQMLAADELLKLYGELAPTQRAALAGGLAFSALTPPQQALFLQFAGRQRPYFEPWRLQQGAIQVLTEPAPPKSPFIGKGQWPVARMVFQVQFQNGDSQAFPVDLVSERERSGWMAPPSQWAGQPFPFTTRSVAPEMDAVINPGWKPVLADSRLRGRAEVILIARPFADPYVGAQPPPSATALARTLAARLQSIGVPLVEVSLRSAEEAAGKARPNPAAAARSNWLQLEEPGDTSGQPFDATNSGARIEQSPTVFVVDSGGIVRGVFEGQAACDAEAIVVAARQVAPHGSAHVSVESSSP